MFDCHRSVTRVDNLILKSKPIGVLQASRGFLAAKDMKQILITAKGKKPHRIGSSVEWEADRGDAYFTIADDCGRFEVSVFTLPRCRFLTAFACDSREDALKVVENFNPNTQKVEDGYGGHEDHEVVWE